MITPKDIVKDYKKFGSLKAAWRHRKLSGPISWKTYQGGYAKAVAQGLMDPIRQGRKPNSHLKKKTHVVKASRGRIKPLNTSRKSLPAKGNVNRFLLTVAQNNTEVFAPFWRNLLILKDYYNAELHISRAVYLTHSKASSHDKNLAFEKLAAKRKGAKLALDQEDIKWVSDFDDYLSDERIELAPGLVWCGEQNILPTAIRPLSGLESYTGRKSCIVPSVKIAMESVPSGKYEPVKLMFTTGTVTQRNYIQRKAGLVAEFHHSYGALLVEVDSEGDWFCRQIVSDSDGVIHDLDIKVDRNGTLTKNNRVEAITWGDIHVAQMDLETYRLAWGEKGVFNTLRPRYQFFHDVLDFRSRSHHDDKKPHTMFKRYVDGDSDVANECTKAAEFLRSVTNKNSLSVVVDSNHHDHLGRWLEEKNGLLDPKNSQFWLNMNQRVYSDIASGVERPLYFALMMKEVMPDFKDFKALARDESMIICHDANGGIECGIHGHSGPNGSRGNPKVYTRMGRKVNIGHVHSASITDGVYVAGTCADLSPDWTTGPTSWSHSHIVTFPNGKRQIITMWNGKWKAGNIGEHIT